MTPSRVQVRLSIHETSEKTGISPGFVLHCLEERWVRPAVAEAPLRSLLDEEDIARVQLIRELQEIFGANDESIPVILHLIDQLYALKASHPPGSLGT